MNMEETVPEPSFWIEVLRDESAIHENKRTVQLCGLRRDLQRFCQFFITSYKISEIIKDVRGNHVTDTWPKQAEMAAEGKWDELKVWQDELDGGIAK